MDTFHETSDFETDDNGVIARIVRNEEGERMDAVRLGYVGEVIVGDEHRAQLADHLDRWEDARGDDYQGEVNATYLRNA